MNQIPAAGPQAGSDPFDRIIVAEAGLAESVLVTKDEKILAHYPHARW